jgi:hypothetical protein
LTGHSISETALRGKGHLTRTNDILTNLMDVENLARELEEAYRRETEGWGDGQSSRGSSLDMIEFVPNVAPPSIFPFGDRICVELAIVSKVFASCINATQVIRLTMTRSAPRSRFRDPGTTDTGIARSR